MDQADTALEGAKNGDMDGAPERVLGRPQVRIEGRAKVTGAALYASDRRVRSTAHAALVTSTIARGRILGLDPFDGDEKLTCDPGHRDLEDIDILLADEVQKQVERPLKTLDVDEEKVLLLKGTFDDG